MFGVQPLEPLVPASISAMVAVVIAPVTDESRLAMAARLLAEGSRDLVILACSRP